MSEVLDIEVDGETEGRDGPGHGGPSAQWGVPVAIALVGSLLLAVLVFVVLPTLTGEGGRPRPVAGPGTTPPAVLTAEPPPVAAESDPKIAAAQAALSAWGEFVADGDLERLKPWFVQDGPQYRQLAEEAQELTTKPGEAYVVTTGEESVATIGESEVVVTARVTWRLHSEQTRQYPWEVVLRRAENDRWLLWTVRVDQRHEQ